MRLLGFLFNLLILAGFIAAILYFTGVLGRRAGGKSGLRLRLSRKDVRAYARRYLKKFPGTKAKSLREALRQEFLPERVAKQSADEQALGCMMFGLGGLLARAAMVQASDSEIEDIKEMIEDVIDELYREDD
ncbi:hypothetical protein [Limnoglobus roseus]|uniref:Uncharacterized protein n=1 Tax=Limnoglobus roseus TaxID=2598579 RepID=A0A5C1A9P8_9BACT|nr:hypothetical protein [Limnoglobus roseus]QEL15450.1 hypothetical protein PX52LOC_02369 [Limnoglobus roseus]